ncbi:uncharacterized protein PgNI_12467 [Pyricularia grisea]|uniref:Uncharacterized protein n=1 Tax=Pyricularia grisea TaxID=148305 RepID=A0A6P8AMD5_PYRGI|nr:uncharacterized protein PgNI_12467 [Pyricularia grisea]TLD03196.1 hypothetical protein PgNI_12467 [Pyricularia grisea]
MDETSLVTLPPVRIRAVVKPALVEIVPRAAVPEPAVWPLRRAVVGDDELDRVLEPAPADAPLARRRLPLAVGAHAPDPAALPVPEADELSVALQVRQQRERAVVLVTRRVTLVRLRPCQTGCEGRDGQPDFNHLFGNH